MSSQQQYHASKSRHPHRSFIGSSSKTRWVNSPSVDRRAIRRGAGRSVHGLEGPLRPVDAAGHAEAPPLSGCAPAAARMCLTRTIAAAATAAPPPPVAARCSPMPSPGRAATSDSQAPSPAPCSSSPRGWGERAEAGRGPYGTKRGVAFPSLVLVWHGSFTWIEPWPS